MEVYSVSQINRYIKGLMDGDGLLRDVTVSGEISNFKRHSSGHYYFSIKDQGSALSAAMFKWANRSLNFLPENGMRVLVHGRISVYEPSGQYQIIADSIQPDGVGALYEQYERLKRALERKGYLDPSRKKPIPQFPRKIAVITSPTGAAIRDILNILGRRFPLAPVDVYPSEVQGENAPAMLASALYAANRNADCDVIIIGRGGGSMEDLWAFNSVDVIKAVICRRSARPHPLGGGGIGGSRQRGRAELSQPFQGGDGGRARQKALVGRDKACLGHEYALHEKPADLHRKQEPSA